MCTKFFSDGDVHMYFNPYDTPYQAFITYMNVLSDFIIRLKSATTIDSMISEKDITRLTKKQISAMIEKYEKAIKKLKKKLEAPLAAIEKTKPKRKAIAKIKPKTKAIDKNKPEVKKIAKTKPEAKAIAKTKKETTVLKPARKKTGSSKKKN
jgi:alpha-amylase